jgi:hypothetical protein
LQRVLISALIVAVPVIVTACGGGDTRYEAIDPLALVTTAADEIRQATQFNMSVDQTGEDYAIGTAYGNVLFRRATASYVSPRTMQANVRVNAAGIPLDIDVFSYAENQWYRAIWTGDNWLNEAFSPGFNPESLIAQDTGFQAALSAVRDLSYVGITSLESGQEVHHLRGTADGAGLNALLVGLIEMQGVVSVEVFISTADNYPARFVLVETVPPGENGEASTRTWTIDITDINGEVLIDPPLNFDATPEVTPEVTAEATQAS